MIIEGHDKKVQKKHTVNYAIIMSTLFRI